MGMKTNVAIIGAGPAGLTAGYLLAKNGVGVVIFETDPVYVGGISRTAGTRDSTSILAGTASFPNQKRLKICGRRFCLTKWSFVPVPRASFTMANSSLTR
jgi:protoporphyrinogen oxidase